MIYTHLKHCPICGHGAEFVELPDDRWFVGCTECSIQTMSAVNSDIVAELWNNLPRRIGRDRLLRDYDKWKSLC